MIFVFWEKQRHTKKVDLNQNKSLSIMFRQSLTSAISGVGDLVVHTYIM